MTKELTPKDSALLDFAYLFPPIPDCSQFLIGCCRADFSASRIARAVEDCNAQLINLNVTNLEYPQTEVVVALRINHRNAEAVARSLERYGYEVIEAVSDSMDVNDSMRMRVNEVLRYLEI